MSARPFLNSLGISWWVRWGYGWGAYMTTPSVHCTSGCWSHFPSDCMLDVPLRSLSSYVTSRPMQASSCTQHCYCSCCSGYNLFSRAEHQRIDAFELWHWGKLKSPLDSKEIKLVNPKGSQPWIFIGRTDSEAEAPILWPSDAKSQVIGKDSDAGKDWGQEKKWTTEDEMVG